MMKPYMELREWCILENEECEWDDCDGCTNNQPRLTKHEENLKECEFTNFIMVQDILPTDVNNGNTLGKTYMGVELGCFIEHNNLESIGYSPANLKQHPLFFMLKKTLGLGVPRKIYIAKDKTCVAIYESDVYLIAPRIESE